MAAVRSVSQFVPDHFRHEKLNVACIGKQIDQEGEAAVNMAAARAILPFH